MKKCVEYFPTTQRIGSKLVNQESMRNPTDRLADLRAELDQYVPDRVISPDHLGFAVPLHLRLAHGELHLMTTITTFATAVDVTIAELKLEAFLPADEVTALILSQLVRLARTAG